MNHLADSAIESLHHAIGLWVSGGNQAMINPWAGASLIKGKVDQRGPCVFRMLPFDSSTVLSLTQRIIALDQGNIVADGPTEKLLVH